MAHRLPVPVPPWLSTLLGGIMMEIDFDTVPAGTVVNTRYPGVTLEAVPLNNPAPDPNFGNVFALKGAGPDSPPNVVSIEGPPHAEGFDESGGGILVTFDTPQVFVSIDAQPIISATDRTGVGNNKPYMDVYGVAIKLPFGKELPGAHLARVYFPLANADPNFASWQTLAYLSLSGTADIGSIVFSSTRLAANVAVYGTFDRLRFAHAMPARLTLEVG